MSSAVVLVAGVGKYHRSEQMPERTADDTERTEDEARETAAEEAAGSSVKEGPTMNGSERGNDQLSRRFHE
jgi:hypothetical protein